MSDDGLDEELIALVGEDPSSSPAADSHAQRRTALLEDSSDEEEERVSYPLQGIYKDEDDRLQLMSMNELEREEVLAQRRDEISRKSQQAQLAAMVRSQQAAAGKSRKGAQSEADRAKRRKRSRDMARRELEDLDDPFAESDEGDVFRESDSEDDRPARRASTTKATKLSELRRKRQERQRSTADRANASDDEPPVSRRRRARSDSDSAYGSEDEYKERRFVKRAPAEAAVLVADSDEPPPLELLNAIRIGRDEMERMLFHPSGPDVLRGCFIRCSWGMRDRPEGGKEHVYRVHQITGVKQREGKFYDVSSDHSGRFLNTYISFQWNGKEHSVDLRPISTQAISESERARWISAAKGTGAKFPSTAAFHEKKRELNTMAATPLTEDDVKKIIVRKRELRAAADQQGTARAQPPTPQASGVRYDEHAMAQINERNRREDRERIQDAERRALRAKRLAAQPPAPTPTAPVSQADVSHALAAAPSGTAVVQSIDIDLGDF